MNSFNAILKNRKYIGEYKYQDVIISGGVPAIVPQELFDRVQARIERNKRAPRHEQGRRGFSIDNKAVFAASAGGDGGLRAAPAIRGRSTIITSAEVQSGKQVAPKRQ